MKYEVLKGAKSRCELCGISNDERALEVDHITPRNKGGTDEISNLQALCYRCNAMKRDRDDTDFRAVRAAHDRRERERPFCVTGDRKIELQNSLAMVLSDAFPVTEGHSLVIPKRHTPDYFDLGTAEMRACQQLITETRVALLEKDPSIVGFNIGVNCGAAAGQTVMHCPYPIVRGYRYIPRK